jgi:hypothetical protein
MILISLRSWHSVLIYLNRSIPELSQRKETTMLKRRTFMPVYIVIAITLALTGILFAQEAAFAQLATPAPAEEAPAAPAPTSTPVAAATPLPTVVVPPAAEAAPAEATPASMPVTGMASNPFPIILVVVGTVVALGAISGFSIRRKRANQE